ncbi:MAG: hypothetical protein N2747_01970, partial [Chitinophagaceae bacterium]|nr:hypothetical protein [Chitinophagaceae bacterium]
QGPYGTDTLLIPANYSPEFKRMRNHDNIDQLQKKIQASDGKSDLLFMPVSNEEIYLPVNRALTKKTDALQFLIETDPALDHRMKVNYLFGLENILNYYLKNWKKKSERYVNPYHLPLILQAYEQCISLDKKGLSIYPTVAKLPYDASLNLMAAGIFDKNAGADSIKNFQILNYCTLYPHKAFEKLSQNPDVPFADSLIRVISRKYPRQLYDYSQASNKLGRLIRNIENDAFVKTVVDMAQSKDGQQYFCFLDQILNGKLSFQEIDAAKGDTIKYYRLLVKTRIEYARRAIEKDTAYEFQTLYSRLERKAGEIVNVINALHHDPPEIRFKIIQPLSAEELYYLAVATEGTIYTSSFVKGVYPLMMKKINQRGDSLLLLLHFDRYRKFIKMAAAFNVLDDFLASFPASKNPQQESDADKLMKAFVSRLENGIGLEDGADVADAYASVYETLKPVARKMLKNVELNFNRNQTSGNKRGMVIYNILHKLFLSADSTYSVNLTQELGIPPIHSVPFSSLTGEDGRVVLQLFIYGDKDGRGVFPTILKLFNTPNWKIDQSNKYWVTVSSVNGKPVTLYMNKPLPEENDEDALAQKELCNFLRKNNINPTITINRGHSYNAPYTIEQMFPSSKIVFMGSCGGYRMIHDILLKSPDAHIIGSKQVADASVNNPFLKLIMEKLRTGSNIDWIPFWAELKKTATDPIFEDYIPPHKNLGALFIKAYKKAMYDDAESSD